MDSFWPGILLDVGFWLTVLVLIGFRSRDSSDIGRIRRGVGTPLAARWLQRVARLFRFDDAPAHGTGRRQSHHDAWRRLRLAFHMWCVARVRQGPPRRRSHSHPPGRARPQALPKRHWNSSQVHRYSGNLPPPPPPISPSPPPPPPPISPPPPPPLFLLYFPFPIAQPLHLSRMVREKKPNNLSVFRTSHYIFICVINLRVPDKSPSILTFVYRTIFSFCLRIPNTNPWSILIFIYRTNSLFILDLCITDTPVHLPANPSIFGTIPPSTESFP